MSKFTRFSTVTLACAALTVACDESGRSELPALDDAQPLALTDTLLYLGYLDDDEPEAILVDVARSEPRVRFVELSPGEVHMYPRPGAEGQEALVLTTGEPAHLEGDHAVDAVNAQVALFARAGLAQRYTLPGRFEALALSEDGRFAVAHARSNDAFDPGRALAVLDLTKLASDPTAAALVNPEKPWATVAERFAFAPASSQRKLAVGFATDHVVLFDLQKPNASAITATLTFPTDHVQVEPEEALFTDARVYVRSHHARSVFVMNLILAPENPLGFTVTPTELSVGSEVSDILLMGDGDQQRLLVLGQDELLSFDQFGSRTLVAELSQTYGSMYVFRGATPFDETVSDHALLVEQDNRHLAFVDLEVSSEVVAPDPELLDLGHPIDQVLPLFDRKRAIVSHRDGALSLVDLEQRTVVPVATGDTPSSLQVDEARARLWVVTQEGALGTIDLNTLSGEQMFLPAPAESVLVVPGAHARVAVVHESEAGYVTLLDAQKPARDTARELRDFMWSGLFD
jgi:hypothetical protein